MTSGNEGIGVEEAPPSRVVISALEVIQTCLPITLVAITALKTILIKSKSYEMYKISNPIILIYNIIITLVNTKRYL